MSAKTISMQKLKEILRLKYSAKLSHRQIAKSLSISPSVVSTYTNRAAQLGIHSWPLEEKWDDLALNRAFLNTKTVLKKDSMPVPDWSQIKQALTNKIMTLQLLWEEYKAANPSQHYSYNHYCRLYKKWLGTQKLSMRQSHKAGEKLFVDYCGKTIEICDPKTGEIRIAQVFVAVLGASNYTYVEATYSQGLEDWIMSHVRCLEFLGGTPELIIPDNLKSAVTRSCRYEPDLNPTYLQFARYYQTTVIPARPYKPKDKSKAEVGVQIVERWIMGRLRHETFYSLKTLNERIQALLVDLNTRKMKKHPGTRLEQFQAIDQPALNPLPQHPYQYTQIKHVRVHIDYHVEINKHYYSVPYTLVKQRLEAHISGQQVKIYHQQNLVAIHPRADSPGRHTTDEQHMPVAHRSQSQWSPARFEQWAQKIGPHTERLVGVYLSQKRHPEQNYRRCLGLLNLAKKYEPEALDAACQRALSAGVYTVKTISNILQKGLEKQPLPNRKQAINQPTEHLNIRGQGYYH